MHELNQCQACIKEQAPDKQAVSMKSSSPRFLGHNFLTEVFVQTVACKLDCSQKHPNTIQLVKRQYEQTCTCIDRLQLAKEEARINEEACHDVFGIIKSNRGACYCIREAWQCGWPAGVRQGPTWKVVDECHGAEAHRNLYNCPAKSQGALMYLHI